MADTPNDEQAPGDDSRGTPIRLDGTYDDAVLTVFRTVQWVPPAYRQAYLDGAASVLGDEALLES